MSASNRRESKPDRNADSDGDTMSNYDEYVAGTDPTNSSSYLKVQQITDTGPATINFLAASNRMARPL